ncbi:hypothetical protein RHSIM_Rhsim02G0163700 [Rhododendron simsii]|uniref:Uncharacterized protein n=1 Tax=Rhododendron simsii TaxID=118357 RepID=A0A834HE42_RHOSS|nr:hypothetical protein RHSIM_Rhsim02G0163700 [Rhododendron simsii]
MLNNGNDNFQARGFSTPPPQGKWRRWSPPARQPLSEKKPQAAKTDLFHIIHKVPAGDSPYVRAKHVQLIEKDPSKAISLFWAAINSGDRVDSALKDMAVVMKQLDRSDEAIEAIKSFRHLCTLESQESLDNVLVELYKRSDRIEDQIEMLQRKVKAIEEGMAFGGKISKSARSQGKKIQITIEQEYSRLLGNLAWAYLQQNNFKSAEDLYRKALSFEADKNKQCNLAICLMHMDRMIEARLLLQTTRASPIDGQSDDSYLKSYARATQVLTELESKSGVGNDQEKPSFGHGNFSESSPQTLFGDAWKKGFYSENSYERKVSFGSKRNDKCISNGGIEPGSFNKKAYYSSPVPGSGIPNVPFTQPRCSSSFSHGDQQRAFWRDFGVGGCSRKLSFEQQMSHQCFDGRMPAFAKERSKAALQKSEIGSPSVNGNWRKTIVKGDLDGNCGENDRHNNLARQGEVFSNGDWDQKTNICTANSVRTTETDETNSYTRNNSGNSGNFRDPIDLNPMRKSKKSWADIVEEDEQELLEFGDENVNSNISCPNGTPLNEIEKLSRKIESIDLKDGYYTQPQTAASSMNRTTRRSLCFDHQQKPCPLALNFEGNDKFMLVNEREGIPGIGTTSLRRNRLQVFRDITVSSESPQP